MPKINLEHFLVTNVAGALGDAQVKGGPKSVRYFLYEHPRATATFFGFIIFPTAFSATGLLDKLLDELKVEFDTEPAFDEVAFEKLIGFFNNKLGLYAGGHKNQKDLARFDICLGATINTKLVFAPLGNISAIIYIPEDQKNRSYNLMKEARGAVLDSETLKLKEIIAGNLTKNNSLIITNEELLDNYSFSEVGDLITGMNARLAAINLQSALREKKSKGTFAGFIIDTIEPTSMAGKNSAISMKELISKRTETEKIIRATAPINLKHATNRVKNLSARLGGWAAMTGRMLWNFAKPFGQFMFIFFTALINWNNKGPENWEAIPVFLSQKKEAIVARIQAMSLVSKIITLGTLGLVIFFIINTTNVALKNHAIAQEQQFKNQMAQIANLRTDAEAAFIQSNNKDQARQSLLDAEKASEHVKTKNPTQALELKTVQDQIQNRLMALWKLQTVALTKPLSNLAIILPKNIIVNAFSPDGKQTICWTNKKISIILNGAIVESFDSDSELSDQFTFANSLLSIKSKTAGRIVQVSLPEHKIFTAEISDWQGNLINFAIQNDKLYALSNENLYITKHQKSLTGFARGSGWLREPIDVKDAVSLAVDGSLYTITDTGEIKKMYNGQHADFNQEHPEPKLTAIGKIWTSENTRLLFTANIPDARLVIYDKKGAVVSQLRFTTIPLIKDFYINDSTRIPSVSLFDGANVYYVDLAPYL